MSLDFELTIGPQFNHHGYKCSDVWSSSSFFKSIDCNCNAYFKSQPIAYFVYGFKNCIIINQIQDDLIRYISSIKVFKSSLERITCLSFSRNAKLPLIFVGAITGSFLIYNLKDNTIQQICKPKDFDNLKTIIYDSDWVDSYNIFFTIDTFIAHWNIKSNQIKLIHKDYHVINCLAISKCDPFFLAFGTLNGKVTVLNLNLKDNPKVFTFNMEQRLCSLSFSFKTVHYCCGLLAAVAKNSHLQIWDLSSHLKIYEKNLQPSTSSNVRKYFVVAFLPFCSSDVLSNDSFTSNEQQEEIESQIHFIVSNLDGSIKVAKFSTFNLNSTLETFYLNSKNTYSHSSTILNFAITNPYIYSFISQDSFHDSSLCIKTTFDLDIPLLAVSLSYDNKAILWDLKNFKAKSAFATSFQTRDMAFSPHQPDLLAIASSDILLWKVVQSNNNEKKNPFNISELSIYAQNSARSSALSWHPIQKNILAVGTTTGDIFIWNLSQAHSSTLYSLSKNDAKKLLHVYTLNWGPEPFSHDLDNLALYCCCSGGWIEVFAPHNEKKYDFYKISNCTNFEDKTDVSWKSDFNYLAIGYTNGSIEIYKNKFKENENLLKVASFENFHCKLIQCLKWHPLPSLSSSENLISFDNNLEIEYFLATSSKDTIIKVLNLRPLNDLTSEQNYELSLENILKDVRILSGHLNEIVTLSWCPLKIGLLASCSYDNTVQVWDVITSTPLYNFRGHSNRIFTVTWSLIDSDLIISGGDDYTIHMWRPSAQKFQKPPQLFTYPNIPKIVRNFEVNQNAKQINQELSGKNFNQLTKDKSFIDEVSQDFEKIHSKTDYDFKNDKKTCENKFKKSTCLHSQQNQSDLKSQPKKKSVIPLTNVAENCSTKQQHLEDIKLIMSQKNLIPKIDEAEDEGRILIFGDEVKISKLIDDEVNKHLINENISFAYQAELILKGDVKKTVKKAIHYRHLTDWLVAMSASVSKPFWIETVKAFSQQLKETGDYLLAASYLISIFEYDKAIQLLIDKHLFKEALIIAKTRFPLTSPIIINILTSWSKEKELMGNFEMAAKILISIEKYQQAGQILAKRENDLECQKLSKILLSQDIQEIGNKQEIDQNELLLKDVENKNEHEVNNDVDSESQN